MKAKTDVKFYDEEKKKIRKVDEIFIVNKKRFADINKKAKKQGYERFVSEYKED